ncbi:MAG: DUF4398 domain-containing protein [Gallionella sp.]|nr:DUF4398 domain-containing protein [Gallionella sp.]
MTNAHPTHTKALLAPLGMLAVAATLLAGCASPTPPIEQLAVSRAAISSANSAGGNEYAPLQSKAAIAKMDAAERAMTEKNYVLARQLAEEAQVDAQLAGAAARTAKAQKAADAVHEDSRVLRKEIDRKKQ